jgi:hypothetical protein
VALPMPESDAVTMAVAGVKLLVSCIEAAFRVGQGAWIILGRTGRGGQAGRRSSASGG